MKPQIPSLTEKSNSSKFYIQWLHHKKLRHTFPQIDGQLFPEIREASCLIALSSGYDYDFMKGTLELTTKTSHDAFITLLEQQYGRLGFIYGGFSTWTHFAVALAINPKEAKDSELISFEEIETKAKKMSLAAEKKWTENFQTYIEQTFDSKSQKKLISDSKSLAPVITFPSELKEHEKLLQEMIAFYDEKPTLDKDKTKAEEQSGFKRAVDLCVTPAIKRFFGKKTIKSDSLITLFSQKQLFCLVRDPETNKPYDIKKLLHRLMALHLLEEMSHLVTLTAKYRLHFILHEGSNKNDFDIDKLLRSCMKIFKPTIEHLGQWQPFLCILAKPVKPQVKEQKSSLLSSSSPLQDEKISPLPLTSSELASLSPSPSTTDDTAREALLDSAESSPDARTTIVIVSRLFKSENGISTVENILSDSPLDEAKNDKFAYNFITSVKKSSQVYTTLRVIGSMLNALTIEHCIDITDQVVKELKKKEQKHDSPPLAPIKIRRDLLSGSRRFTLAASSSPKGKGAISSTSPTSSSTPAVTKG